jgi:hypothetical protein
MNQNYYQATNFIQVISVVSDRKYAERQNEIPVIYPFYGLRAKTT